MDILHGLNCIAAFSGCAASSARVQCLLHVHGEDLQVGVHVPAKVLKALHLATRRACEHVPMLLYSRLHVEEVLVVHRS